jgi:predicted DsbA family dithiol-disulfide isomerase
MARYAMAAEKQGKFWDINSKFFELQPETEEAIIDIAKDLNLDVDKLKKDANSDKTKKELEETIKEAYAKGVDATPSMRLNDTVYIGIKPYPELKKMLEDAGAKSR